MKFVEIDLPDATATRRLGFELASAVQTRALITLIGELGAGKTTLAQGAAQALGIEAVVNSPTFTMINEYAGGRVPFYHLDVYRLGETGEASIAPTVTAELDEILAAPGLVLVEWADYLAAYIDQYDHVRVELNYSTLPSKSDRPDDSSTESGRIARISGFGEQAEAIIERMRIVYFS